MRAEFYISQIIRWNPRLRGIVSRLTGLWSGDDEGMDLLAEFRGGANLDNLAGRFHCGSHDVFHHLRDRIYRVLIGDGHTQVPQLKSLDVALFFRESFVRRIASLLGSEGEWSEVAGALFDRGALESLAHRSGLFDAEEKPDTAQLFWRLVSPDGLKRVFNHLGGPVDVWSLLTSILRSSASDRLCDQLACSPEEIFPVLAVGENATPISSSPVASTEPSRRLDSLGVVRLREMLRAASEAYVRQARDAAEDLQATTDYGRIGSQAVALIDFHVRHAYRSALTTIYRLDMLVADVVAHVEQLTPGEPSQTAGLRATVSPHVDDAGERVLIEYSEESGEEWVPFLRLEGIHPEHAQSVVKNLPHSVEGIQGGAATLRERLLQLTLTLPESSPRTLWGRWLAHDTCAIHYFVLSGSRLPGDSGPIDGTGYRIALGAMVPEDLRTICPSSAELHERASRALQVVH